MLGATVEGAKRMWTTHEVLNQPPPLTEINAWKADTLLRAHAEAFGAVDPEFARTAESLGAYVSYLRTSRFPASQAVESLRR